MFAYIWAKDGKAIKYNLKERMTKINASSSAKSNDNNKAGALVNLRKEKNYYYKSSP